MGKVFLHDGAAEFGAACLDICRRLGFQPTDNPDGAEFGLAPRLLKIVPLGELNRPRLGTLIFHPSILPYHRGPDAIRWTVNLGERVGGVTWFWADDGADTGPICEQAAVLLAVGESAGRAYYTRFMPAGLRALERAVEGIAAGRPRRVEQEEGLATYEGKFRLRLGE